MTTRYTLIVGGGRSGTNWLFDLLNLSPLTNCRNATYNALPNSTLAALLRGFTPLTDFCELEQHWDSAIRELRYRMGALDGPIPVRKAHFVSWAESLGVVDLVSRRRLRQMIAPLLASLKGDEWSIPTWMIHHSALDEAMLVLRTGPSISCLEWILSNRPHVPVLHMVRHPGGFLNSWLSRFAMLSDLDEIRRQNALRLEEVKQAAPSWGDIFQDIGNMSHKESELWYWRYATETVWQLGRNYSHYKIVLFESLASNTKETLRSVYAHADIDWDEKIVQDGPINRSRFTGKPVTANAIANAWHSKLAPEDIALVEKVLEGSPLVEFWS